ncbi:RNA methyltransferase [Zavarzinella formosa]|nr:hypothetical protein [Zavarzinella formosa]
MKGYFGIGIENCKTGVNVGTLWRSAHNLAALLFPAKPENGQLSPPRA